MEGLDIADIDDGPPSDDESPEAKKQCQKQQGLSIRGDYTKRVLKLWPMLDPFHRTLITGALEQSLVPDGDELARNIRALASASVFSLDVLEGVLAFLEGK